MANNYLAHNSRRSLPWFLGTSLVLHSLMLFSLNNKNMQVRFSPQGSPAQQSLQVSLQENKIERVIKRKTIVKKLKKKADKKTVPTKVSQKITKKVHKLGNEQKFKSFIKNYTEPVYPRIAQRRTLVGNVLLELNISKKGDLLSVKIAKSSGHEILDTSALSAAKLWTFKPLASDMEQISLRKKIVFAMKI